jgi:hypothetical protein
LSRTTLRKTLTPTIPSELNDFLWNSAHAARPALRSYGGELEVDGGDFALVAERLIVGADALSFRMMGYDHVGGFVAEGVAKKVEALFVSSGAAVIYESGHQVPATVEFTTVDESTGSAGCRVSGIWLAHGRGWSFGGSLQSFDPSSRGVDAQAAHRGALIHTASSEETEATRRRLDKRVRQEEQKATIEARLTRYIRKARKNRKASGRGARS